MKKIVAIILALVLVFSLSLTAVAELGGFIESPSNNKAPELVSAKNEDEDCEAKLSITAYADRDELSQEIIEKLEEAYGIIVKADDLSELNSKVEDFAKKRGVKVADLAVSDMFDISAAGCNDHEGHGHFDIALKSDTLKNFVCLIHYYEGKWNVVEDAKVTQDGTHLEFTEKEFSPFAIVVNTGAEGTSPETIDNSNTVWYVAVMVVCALGLLVVLKKQKKNVSAN